MFRFIRTILLTLLVLAAGTTAGYTVWAAPADNDFTDSLDIIDILVDGSDNSTAQYGFQLKEVDGPQHFGYRVTGVSGMFYPASTIKVFHHLTAMMAVDEAGPQLLQKQIPVYIDSCDNPPNNPAGSLPLSAVLQGMMVNSNNDMTNAVAAEFGQSVINDTMHDVVGLSNLSHLNHRLGCGGPTNDPANHMILDDITHLYERYIAGELLSPSSMQTFESLMLNETNSGLFGNYISQQSNQLGLTDAEEQAFNSYVNFAVKAGSYQYDTDGDEVSDAFYRSIAGFIELPNKTCDGVEMKQYAYGAYINNADAITNGGVMGDAVRRMMRDEIRNALSSFRPKPLNECISNFGVLVPQVGGQLTINAPTQVYTLVLDMPAGRSVTHTMRIEAYVRDTISSTPRAQTFADAALLLQGVAAGRNVTRSLPAQTMLSLTYDDSMTGRVLEDTLRWYRWNESRGTWMDAADSCATAGEYRRDTAANTLTVPVCELGEYALFGESNPNVSYMPFLSASTP